MSVHRDVADLLERYGAGTVLEAIADGAESCSSFYGSEACARSYHVLAQTLRLAAADVAVLKSLMAAGSIETFDCDITLADGCEVFADICDEES